jgi:hypothetical protein
MKENAVTATLEGPPTPLNARVLLGLAAVVGGSTLGQGCWRTSASIGRRHEWLR